MDKDLVLVKETLDGNKAAFGKLIEDYQNFVFSIAFKVLRSREDAEEAAQDTFIKAYRSLAGFEGKSKFATWLYQIAWRTAIDKQRSRASYKVSLTNDGKFIEVMDTSKNASDLLQDLSQSEAIQLALRKLRPQDAALITLYYLNEQSVKEICQITGFTESNIKIRLFRLREVLKNELTMLLKNEVNQIL
jgi:RNA polymerase sigma-70 factor (ECF subfamily)